MADSIRQQIIDAVDTRLKTILVSNGYETDVGKYVDEWRAYPQELAKLPALVYRDSNATSESTFGTHVHDLRVEIEVTASGATAPKTIRKMAADVTKAVATDLTWGGLAEDTRIEAQPQDIQIEQESKRIASTLLAFNVVYRTERFNPYA